MRAVLEHVVGERLAARFRVLAGDVVPAKKPAPDIYLLAIDRLGVDADDALVVEDSRNGLLAAVAAGLRCVVTVSGYTESEDHHEAVLVVSSLGDPGGENDSCPCQPQPGRSRRVRHARRSQRLPGRPAPGGAACLNRSSPTSS